MAVSNMKSLILFLFGIALFGAMIVTNPTMDDYSKFLGHKYVQGTDSKDDVTKGFALILGGIAGGVMSSETTRKNYLLFSTYETNMGTKTLVYIGIFKNFINLEEAAQP